MLTAYAFDLINSVFAGGAESARASFRIGKGSAFGKFCREVWCENHLRHTLAVFNNDVVFAVIVQANYYFAAVVAVYDADLICGSYAALASHAASGVYKAYDALGYFK